MLPIAEIIEGFRSIGKQGEMGETQVLVGSGERWARSRVWVKGEKCCRGLVRQASGCGSGRHSVLKKQREEGWDERKGG